MAKKSTARATAAASYKATFGTEPKKKMSAKAMRTAVSQEGLRKRHSIAKAKIAATQNHMWGGTGKPMPPASVPAVVAKPAAATATKAAVARVTKFVGNQIVPVADARRLTTKAGRAEIKQGVVQARQAVSTARAAGKIDAAAAKSVAKGVAPLLTAGGGAVKIAIIAAAAGAAVVESVRAARAAADAGTNVADATANAATGGAISTYRERRDRGDSMATAAGRAVGTFVDSKLFGVGQRIKDAVVGRDETQTAPQGLAAAVQVSQSTGTGGMLRVPQSETAPKGKLAAQGERARASSVSYQKIDGTTVTTTPGRAARWQAQRATGAA